MKQLIFCSVFLLCSGICSSQDKVRTQFDHDISFGLNASIGLKMEALETRMDYRPVFEGGLFFDMNLGKSWHFFAEGNYTFVGFNASQIIFINTPSPYYRYTYIDRLHIVSMPVGVYRTFGHRFAAGLGYSYNHIAGYRKRTEEWNEVPAEQPGIDIRKVDLAFFADLRYAVTPLIAVKLRGRYGVVTVVHNAEDRYNRWVSLGLSYALMSRNLN